MINKLKDCQKTTLIGQLPDIINSNNDAIENEFNWIFDSSLNRLTKSVYSPTGSVKAHFGEFVNLACEYLTVKNIDSIQDNIQRSTENIVNKILNVSSMQIVMAALTNIANSSFIDPTVYNVSSLCDISTLIVSHNLLNDRFFNEDDFGTTSFTHDAQSIVYKKENGYVTVSDSLNTIIPNVKILNTSVNILENDLAVNTERLNTSVNILENDLAVNTERLNTSVNILENDLANHVRRLDTSVNELDTSVNILENKLVNTNTSVNELSDIINAIKNTLQIYRVVLTPGDDKTYPDTSLNLILANGQPFGPKLFTPEDYVLIISNDQSSQLDNNISAVRQMPQHFVGWFDASDNQYNSDTIVQLSDDTLVLNAKWEEGFIHDVIDDPGEIIL